MKTILTILAAMLCAVSAHAQASFLGGKAAVTSLHAQTNFFIVVIGGGTNAPIRSVSPSNVIEILKALPNWPVTGTNLITLASGSATVGTLTGSNGVAFGPTGRYVWKADTGLGYLYDNIAGSSAIAIDDATSYVSINPSLGVVRSVTIGETNFVNVIKFVGGQVLGTGLLGTDGSTNAVTLTLGAGLNRSGTVLYSTSITNNDTRAVVFTGDFTVNGDGFFSGAVDFVGMLDLRAGIQSTSTNLIHVLTEDTAPATNDFGITEDMSAGRVKKVALHNWPVSGPVRTLITTASNAAVAASQPLDTDLTDIAALATTAYGQSFLVLANATAARSYIGAVIGTDVQAFDADLTDLADGSLTGSKVGTGIDDDNVSFDDADNVWTATGIGAALEEMNDSINAGVPNGAGAKVHWAQLLGVPAGFADNTDDGAGGGGSPGGAVGDIQYHNGASGFAGTSAFNYDSGQFAWNLLASATIPYFTIGRTNNAAGVTNKYAPTGITVGGAPGATRTWSVNLAPSIASVTEGGLTVETNALKAVYSNHTDSGTATLPWRNAYAESFYAKQGVVLGTNGAATLTIRAPLMALDATNVIEPRIRIPVARQARVFYSVTGSGGVNTIIETNDYVAFTNGNTVLASGSLMLSNVFQWGITNMGTNGSISVDWNGPRYGRHQLNGDTTISFTNPPALGTPGRSFTLEIAHVGVSSAVTVQTIGGIGINWQDGGSPVVLANRTNFLDVVWNGTNFIGSSRQDITSGSGAAALTNAPTISGANLAGATTLATTTNQQAQHFLVETRLIPTNSALSNIVVNFATTNTVELWVTNNLTFTNWVGISDSGSVPLLYLIRPQLINRGVNWGNLGLSNPGFSVAIATNANNLLWTTLTNGKTYALSLTRVRTNIFPTLTLWE
jgi:hypothetical protein